jgi:hypothetical protein
MESTMTAIAAHKHNHNNKGQPTQSQKSPSTPPPRPAKRMKVVWMVEDRERDGEKVAYWTRMGAAFENRDGSWSLELSAIPVTGRLQLRDPAPPKDKDGEVV